MNLSATTHPKTDIVQFGALSATVAFCFNCTKIIANTQILCYTVFRINICVGGNTMAISYNRLWKLLIDRKMKKKDLVEMAGVSWSTIVKMGRDEHVSTDIVVKICVALECDVDEVMEIVPKNDTQ